MTKIHGMNGIKCQFTQRSPWILYHFRLFPPPPLGNFNALKLAKERLIALFSFSIALVDIILRGTGGGGGGGWGAGRCYIKTYSIQPSNIRYSPFQ